jgi:hypothetical protein
MKGRRKKKMESNTVPFKEYIIQFGVKTKVVWSLGGGKGAMENYWFILSSV